MAVTVQSNVIRMTADGDTYIPGGKIFVKGVRLVNGANNTEIHLHNLNVSGHVLLKMNAPASGSAESRIPMIFEGGIYLMATGAGAEVYIYLE